MKEELIFAGILFLSQASPGPDQAFVTRSTLAYGFGAGVMAALGIGTGIVAHAALACTVGASVFHSFLGLGLFCAASCWMLYLAWKIWPRGRNAFLAGCGDIPPASCIYRDALVTNLMNPKATFFFVALSAPLLEKNHDPSYALLIGFLIVATGTVGCRNTGWNIVPCAGGVRIQHAVFFWPHDGGKFFLMQKWRRGFFPVKITLVLTMTPLYRIHLHPLWKAERARM